VHQSINSILYLCAGHVNDVLITLGTLKQLVSIPVQHLGLSIARYDENCITCWTELQITDSMAANSTQNRHGLHTWWQGLVVSVRLM